MIYWTDSVNQINSGFERHSITHKMLILWIKKLNLTSLLMHDWEARAKKKIYVPIHFNYVKPIKPKSLHFRLLYIF